MNENAGNIWPEQEAIYKWIEKYSVQISGEAIAELKELATENRLVVQKERDYYKTVAEKLWNLLDDIDTTDDIAKENDKNYRKMCQSIMKQRLIYAESPDGYNLVFNKEALT